MFAAQFALSHACWLGAGAGMAAAFTATTVLALLGIAAATIWSPVHDLNILDHRHDDLPPDHEHLAADAAYAAYAAATRATVVRRTVKVQDDLAWVASEGRTTGKYKGKPIDRLTAGTMVLTRVGEAWCVVHIHWSSRVPKVKAKTS